ncbi:MAG: thiamine pyrophosphate-binding protein [bacterium]|nr:thiamine pyrophosphate-binding protein [bacterium]MXZ31557.1 thiamine pyrophosphate-binding protein [Acidimicrobiia bacterium]MYB25356.1 thiamine pyrophosphate-binding protein [Acidimicrobiia bacterium]MYJ13847.1 thiamine pyrophosphate-binding protein [Acidimicrobiia bacterium]
MKAPVRHGGRVLVDALRRHGVERIFTVPGESFLAVLDALHDEPAIRTVVCRHESGAAIMAEATARLRGDLGVAFVTRGPGATHASVAVHNASVSGAALLLFVGQVPRAHRGRRAFQEVDFEAFFAPLAKWAVEVDRPESLSETAAEASRVARGGRPGPVVVSLPEDVLASEAAVVDAPVAPPPQRPAPSPEDLAELGALLRTASRPLVIVGGGTWSQATGQALVAWAERSRLPVAVTFRRQDYLDNDSPSYVGYAGVGTTPALANRIRDADLILAIGTRLGDTATGGYTLLAPPVPGKTLVHIHPDPAELGSVYRPRLAVCAGAPETVAALANLDGLEATPWRDWAAAARVDYEESLRRRPAPGRVDFGEVIGWLDGRLPPEAILTNGAGNFSLWPQRYYRFKQYGTQLGPQSGAMGYAVPAAVAAKLHAPEAPVVAFCGDGDFLMTAQELATAVQYEAPIIVVVVNNGMFATIRMHQERTYPDRPSGSDLLNPDFAAYAGAFGGFGATIEDTEQFAEAFEQALASGVPAVLELRVDPEAILPQATLSEIRAAARRV